MHEPIVGVDGEVAALNSGGLVAGALDLSTPLGERCVVVGFDRFGGGQRSGDTGGGERGEEGAGDAVVDLHAANRQATLAVTVDQGAVGAVVAGVALAPR